MPKRTMRIQLMHHGRNTHWWRVLAANGEVLLTSQMYRGHAASRNRSARRFAKTTGIPVEEKS